MQLTTSEMAMIWFALLIEQKEYEKGGKEWFRREKLIRRFEAELGMEERPVLGEVTDEGKH